MPLWVAALLFLLCSIGTAKSFRAYFCRAKSSARSGAKLFFTAGIALLLLSIAALLYVAAVLLFVISIP